jgi:hypothetical protein
MEAATIQDYRASLMPSFIQSFKLAHDQGIAGRKLFGLLAAVIAIGWIIGVQMNVRLGYQYGGLTLQGWFSQWGPQMLGRNVATLSSGSNGVDPSAWLWTAIGAAATGGMVVARSYLPWFPLHPLGYIMATTYPARAFWFSIMLAWLAKSLLGRFGGLEVTRKLTPAFLGLALGDVSMMLFWLIVDGWLGRTNHQLMPG